MPKRTGHTTGRSTAAAATSPKSTPASAPRHRSGPVLAVSSDSVPSAVQPRNDLPPRHCSTMFPPSSRMHVYVVSQPLMSSLSHAHTYTHTHMHTYTRTHIHTYTHTHIHTRLCINPHTLTTHTTLYTLNTTDAFHEYAVEFSSTHIAWALDGKVFQNISTKSECHNGNHQYVHKWRCRPFDPLLS